MDPNSPTLRFPNHLGQRLKATIAPEDIRRFTALVYLAENAPGVYDTATLQPLVGRGKVSAYVDTLDQQGFFDEGTFGAGPDHYYLKARTARLRQGQTASPHMRTLPTTPGAYEAVTALVERAGQGITLSEVIAAQTPPAPAGETQEAYLQRIGWPRQGEGKPDYAEDAGRQLNEIIRTPVSEPEAEAPAADYTSGYTAYLAGIGVPPEANPAPTESFMVLTATGQALTRAHNGEPLTIHSRSGAGEVARAYALVSGVRHAVVQVLEVAEPPQ